MKNIDRIRAKYKPKGLIPAAERHAHNASQGAMPPLNNKKKLIEIDLDKPVPRYWGPDQVEALRCKVEIARRWATPMSVRRAVMDEVLAYITYSERRTTALSEGCKSLLEQAAELIGERKLPIARRIFRD